MKKIILITLLLPALVFAQAKHPIKKKPKVHAGAHKGTIKPAQPSGKAANGTTNPPVVPYNQNTVVEAVPNTDVVSYTDHQPEFSGGQQAWVNFLQRNLDASGVLDEQDSSSLATYGHTQSVQVQFVVCQDGNLCNFEIANPGMVSDAAAREAIRVMKKSPAWKPGMLSGKPVKVKYTQRITFQLMD